MASQSAAVRKSATAEIRVRPINGFIGAEIEGADLRRPLSPSQFKIVHDALVPGKRTEEDGRCVHCHRGVGHGARG